MKKSPQKFDKTWCLEYNWVSNFIMLNNQMKQKRKVKSLISRKSYVKGKILTVLLLVLSLVLCIWSVSLLTHSVKAAVPISLERTITIKCVYSDGIEPIRDPVIRKCRRLSSYTYDVPEVMYYEPDVPSVSDTCMSDREYTVRYNPIHDLNGNGIADEEENLQEVTSFTYTWLDNRVEVIYSMQFVDPLDLKRFVNSIYVSGGSLYITPNPVIVNYPSNIVDTGMYSHILWWSDNKVYSDNVTLIAWKDNVVYTWNENASVLWWIGNKFYPWESGWKPLISIWWKSNIVKPENGHDWVVLIWWSGNVISGVNAKVSNSFILWWEENSIVGFNSTISGVIIWWTRILVEWHNNIFAYSNESARFTPASSNAFYLNMVEGVWINTWWIEWLSVGGAVSFWEINIGDLCTEERLWTIWTYSGCLVWCTEKSRQNWHKRQMLDQWSVCAAKCNSMSYRCYMWESAEIEPDNYPAECTVWVVNTGNARVCSEDLSKYKNVIFETSLIDSETTCPSDWKNVCLYQCNEGYHLTGDYAWWTEEIGCFKDCEINWADSDEVQNIKHNETVFWFSSGSLSCEGWTDNICNNFKKNLVCVSWTVYIANDDWTAILDSEEEAGGYNYKNCGMVEFQCDRSDTGYKLSWNSVKSDLSGYNGQFPSPVADRSIITWTAWIYEVCYDYTTTWAACEYWGNNFKRIGCVSWYTFTGWACKKDCANGLAYGETGMFYAATWVECTGSCDGKELKCDNGGKLVYRKLIAINPPQYSNVIVNENDYPYTWCNLLGKQCSWYNVTEAEYNEWRSNWAYTGCTKYGVENNACVAGSTFYKLEYCYTWYHTENGKWCVEDYKQCLTPDDPALWIEWLIAGSGRYYYSNPPSPNHWNYVTGNSNPWTCQWSCADGYERDWNWCKPIGIPTCAAVMPVNYYDSSSMSFYITWAWIVLPKGSSVTKWSYTWSTFPWKCEFTCNYWTPGVWYDIDAGECTDEHNDCYSDGLTFPLKEWACKDGSTGYNFTLLGEGLYGWNCDENWADPDFQCKSCLYDLYEIGGSCVTECHHCAVSWFPYCFPIKFWECNEWEW